MSARAAFRTFLIADVRGYSSFAALRGDEATAALAERFAETAGRVVEEHGGELVELRGDEVLAAFESPRQAVHTALALQERLLERTRDDPSLPLPAGLGLDVGEAVTARDGYRANAINVAARLCSVATAGEVLATREVAHLAQAIDGVRYLTRQPARLKGIAEPVQYVRVVDAGVDTVRGFVGIGKTHAAPPPRHHRTLPAHRALALAVVVVVAADLAIVGAAAVDRSSSVHLAANSLGALDLSDGATRLSLPVGEHPTTVAVAPDGDVWVTSSTAGVVSHVDAATHNVVPVQVGAEPSGIAIASDGSVWVANSADGTVSRINPQTNAAVQTVNAGAGASAVAITESPARVWVANTLDASVSEIDPGAGHVVATIPVGAEPAGIAAGDGSVWVTNEGDGTVVRLSAATGQPLLAPIPVGKAPIGVAYGDGAAWVANSIDGTLSRIDATSDAVTTLTVGAGAYAVAVTDNRVWVSNEFGDSLSLVDPARQVVTRTVTVPSAPLGLAIGGGRLWVAADGIGTEAHGGGVLTADATGIGGPFVGDPQSVDPAPAYIYELWRILVMTSDGLVAYRRVGGLPGGTLVPDLATSLPTPTDGGRTYTFRLRDGMRYSTGQPVRASDFRYALERAFKVGGGPTFYFEALAGGAACGQHPPRCDLSRGVVADDTSGTVTFHLSEPDPEFLNQLALPAADPVPPGTPVHLKTGTAVPGTGAYKVATLRPLTDSSPPGAHGRLVLVRNPYFRQWSAAAQPTGFPDRVVINTGYSLGAETAAVLHGKADMMWDQPDATGIAQIAADVPEQVHRDSESATSFVWMNTRKPPFDSVLARRALNYALDRGRIARSAGDTAESGRPTCQLIPPDFPGYKPYCPYTVSPSGGGHWTAPDLAKARQVVRQSGTRGDRVTFIEDDQTMPAIGTNVVRALRSIGYRASVKRIPSQSYYAVASAQHQYEAGLGNWASDYVAASNFLSILLPCSAISQGDNLGRYCDHATDQRIHQALNDQSHRAGPALAEWTALDRLAVDEAIDAPIANPIFTSLVARRVGNYQYNPQWGPLVDQLWVR